MSIAENVQNRKVSLVGLLAGGPKYVSAVPVLYSAGPAPEDESIWCLASFRELTGLVLYRRDNSRNLLSSALEKLLFFPHHPQTAVDTNPLTLDFDRWMIANTSVS